MRGRKPKAQYLRLLDGGAGHRPVNLDEPQPTGDINEPPEELTDREKRVWRDAIARAPPGMLKLLDTSVFQAWVVAVATVEEIRAKKAGLGLITKNSAGAAVVNPLLAQMKNYMNLVRQLAAELGFSPTARPRVKIPKPGPRENPFGELRRLDD